MLDTRLRRAFAVRPRRVFAARTRRHRTPAAHPHLCPNHGLRQLPGRHLRGLARQHPPPPPQHRHSVGRGQHLVQLVRHQDDPGPGARHLTQHGEEPLHLLRRQHGRRLVQQKHARLAHQRLQDLHPLALHHPQPANRHVQLHRQTQFLRARLHLFPVPGAAHSAARPRGLVEERHVLEPGEARHEREVLMHHRDTEPARPAGSPGAQRLPTDLDRARIRRQNPGRHARQRRLSGAVFAQQPVDLARRERKIDLVERGDRPEPARHAR